CAAFDAQSRPSGALIPHPSSLIPLTTMQGLLTLDDLRKLATSGDVETVLVVFPDMYGRLVGKRIVARYFLDEVVEHGMHACDYLLACDVDMDPVPGYQFTSWAKGYGDFRPVT